MKILEVLAAFHNWLSDKDFIWWPFSFLRPEPNVPMTLKLTSQMTGCFGGLTYVFLTIFSVANNAFALESNFFTLLMSFLGFFMWFNLITKPLWNLRAKKLKK